MLLEGSSRCRLLTASHNADLRRERIDSRSPRIARHAGRSLPRVRFDCAHAAQAAQFRAGALTQKAHGRGEGWAYDQPCPGHHVLSHDTRGTHPFNQPGSRAMVGVVIEYRSKQVRRICHACQERKARFEYRGHVRADRHHTLCFECFRAERNRQRARVLARTRRARASIH
jgi:hypothetical protein